ncbi:MAG: DUF190 domain-containing protein [Pseudomonadota bacterium]
MNQETIKITAYINESDKWEHKPLYLEILRMLHHNGVSGGTVLHAIAGFTNKGTVETTTMVDVGSQLPLVIEFIDTVEKVESVLAELKKMTGSRLLVREKVEII